MAILAVKIDDRATLRMNEFFDYAGFCWALSKDREQDGIMGAELEDFYDATVRSSQMDDVPVVFVYEDQILGWYKKAVVYRYIRRPSLFMEGNICANVRDVCLLLKPEPFSGMNFGKEKNYLVIEKGDIRYEMLVRLIETSKGPFEAVEYAKVPMDGRRKLSVKCRTPKERIGHLLELCEIFAQEIMDDQCSGIGTIKALSEISLEATRMEAANVNAWYYHAMANYHLGNVKKGLKSIDRAIRLEPNADDLLVMKGNLMVSNGCLEEALTCYESAYAIVPDDSYYVMAGQACRCMGNRIAADQYYKKVKDSEVLEEFGITLGKKRG